jgi:hypothetical protein
MPILGLLRKLYFSDHTIDIRDSVIDKQEIDPDVLESLASQTISALFGNVTGPLVRRSLAPLFEYSL